VWTWGILVVCQLMLAADGFLALRLMIAEVGREYFKDHGWYAEHGGFQGIGVGMALVCLGAVAGAWVWLGRRMGPGVPMAIFGSVLSLVPFVMASISLHAAEDLMNWPLGILGIGTALRVIGSACGGLGGLRFLLSQCSNLSRNVK